MSGMNVSNSQRGDINVLLIPLITAVILLFGSLGFGIWAFVERQDYKDNSDQKAEAAVTVAVEKAKTQKDNEFLEREKEPLRQYTGPAQFGSITLKYPKTWSVYEKSDDQKHTVLMQPNIVSGATNTSYALKVEVLDTAYNQTIAQSEGLLKQGKLTASAYSFPKTASVVGLRFDGEISNGKRGSVVFMPLRDKTIKISAESEDRIADFNGIILPEFTFQP